MKKRVKTDTMTIKDQQTLPHMQRVHKQNKYNHSLCNRILHRLYGLIIIIRAKPPIIND